jgi:hypothetical protein
LKIEENNIDTIIKQIKDKIKNFVYRDSLNSAIQLINQSEKIAKDSFEKINERKEDTVQLF